MQTSATGIRTEGGFTLLELLVVLAVLAILARMSLSALQPPQGRIDETAAVRVQTLLSTARAKAIASGAPARVNVSGEPADRPVSALDVALPAALKAAWKPSSTARQASEAIWFYPDGSATAGDLEVVAGKSSVRLRVDPWGRLQALDRR